MMLSSLNMISRCERLRPLPPPPNRPESVGVSEKFSHGAEFASERHPGSLVRHRGENTLWQAKYPVLVLEFLWDQWVPPACKKVLDFCYHILYERTPNFFSLSYDDRIGMFLASSEELKGESSEYHRDTFFR